jgi:hypothetical protein
MKYAVALVLLVTLVFAADNNTSQKKPVKKVYPRGTISTH